VRRGGRAEFDLFLFTRDISFARHAVAAGVTGIVIDWERAGKRDRQADADTEVNGDTVDDLRRMRAAVSAPILCRINSPGERTAQEIDLAVAVGADEVLVPMVRAVGEVEQALAHADGRVGVGILVETDEALACVSALARLPICRMFVGLNDLAIQRKSASIFQALVDGTVDGVRASFDGPLGVAGATLPEAGDPLPSRLLMGELARLPCEFTFLRRSFRRDVRGRRLHVEVPRVRDALADAFDRDAATVLRDRAEFLVAVDRLDHRSSVSGVATIA
jgi:hypothetical protein